MAKAEIELNRVSPSESNVMSIIRVIILQIFTLILFLLIYYCKMVLMPLVYKHYWQYYVLHLDYQLFITLLISPGMILLCTDLHPLLLCSIYTSIFCLNFFTQSGLSHSAHTPLLHLHFSTLSILLYFICTSYLHSSISSALLHFSSYRICNSTSFTYPISLSLKLNLGIEMAQHIS